jgi:cytochrome P450
MAFDQGPRNCIGIRFTLIKVKLHLIRLLRQYTVLPSEKTEQEFTIYFIL